MVKKNIGFLGTGLMGYPMARNLLAAGFNLRVWNRSAGKAKGLRDFGATVCADPAQAIENADVIISMVSDGTITLQLIDELPAKAGAIWIDMSSTKPKEAKAAAKQLESRQVAFLDAPVSGGVKGAEDASLAIMVGGAQSVFSDCLDVLCAMGNAVRVGDVGSGQLAKLANQAIVAITIGAVAEATLLLEKGGADANSVRQALRGGFADSTILQMHGARMSARDFTPGGLSRLQAKDLANILEEAGALGLELPMTQDVQARYIDYCENLNGAEKDHSGLFEELLKRNAPAASRN